MNLSLPTINLEKYKSASQRARVGTESWGSSNFFCSSCESSRLEQASRNTAAIDFVCPICNSTFQLKSQSKPFGAKIVDAAYSEMKRAILEDRTPNLFVLHCDLTAWTVRTVVLIPRFAFSLSALERRKPLAPKARRAGWVGCNILLGNIPQDARIRVVQDGTPRPPSEVRHAYQRLRPLENLKVEKRGWTLDVLEVVRSLVELSLHCGRFTHMLTLWANSTRITLMCMTKSANNFKSFALSASSVSSEPARIALSDSSKARY